MAAVRSVVPTASVATLTLPDGLAALLTLGVFTFVGGPLGALAGIAVVGTRLATTSLVTFAVGQLLLLGVVAAPSLLALVLVELALLPFLFSAFWESTTRTRTIGLCVGWLAALVVLLVVLHAWLDATWLLAVVFAGLLSLIAYALHRYELVVLGLVEATEEVAES